MSEAIECLLEASDIQTFLKELEGSRPCSHPCSVSLIQALRNSWSLLSKILKRLNTCHGEKELEDCTFTSSAEELEVLPAVGKACNETSSEFWALVALEYSWEQLHSGPWHNVHLFWRQTYSLAAILSACNLALAKKPQEALVTIDKGILMGSPILNNLLHTLARHLHNTLKQSEGQKVGRSDTKRMGKVKFRNYSPENSYIACKKTKLPPSPGQQESKNVPMVDMARRIAVTQCPTLEEFYDRYMTRSAPVVLTGAMDHWPAYAQQKWSLSYLKGVAGPRTVPVELGSKYTDSEWSQKLMTVSEFIDEHVVGVAHGQPDHPKAYLAQHQLFDQVPELREDICVPEYCYLRMAEDGEAGERCQQEVRVDQDETREAQDEKMGQDDEDSNVRINCWFGPQGTISPLHFDPEHNLLSQVVGRKYVRLYTEDQTPYLYPHTGLLSNTSQVAVESPDMSSFPLFHNAHYSEFILHAGQMLYIPPRCWHYIRSLDTSFSVSFWWS